MTNWNPHQVLDRGSDTTPEGQLVSANGRNGGLTAATAFDGVNDGKYFVTPAAFYDTVQPNEFYPADTGMVRFDI